MHVIAAKAVCFKEALSSEFKEYAKQIIENAKTLCKKLQDRGFQIVSGGTDNLLKMPLKFLHVLNHDLLIQ